MHSMRFWVTAMTRNRRAQNDSRQQSLDFGPVLYAAQVREQQTVTKTLRLLGSNAAATDADLTRRACVRVPPSACCSGMAKAV